MTFNPSNDRGQVDMKSLTLNPRPIVQRSLIATNFQNYQIQPVTLIPTPISAISIPLRSNFPPTLIHNPNSDIVSRAIREYQVGNFDTAETLFLQWISELGENPQPYIMLASLSLKQRKMEKANQYTDHIFNFNVCIPEPYIFKGIIYREKGNIVEAMNFFHVALQIKPESSDALIGLASCHLSLNDLDNAINYCILAIQKQPDSYLCRHELGNMLKIAGRLEEAKLCYEKVLEKKNDYAPAWLNLGYIFLAMGSIWLALHHFEKAIHFDPMILDSYLAFGNLLKDLKLNDRAVQNYLKALSIFPSNPLVFGNLAGAYHEQGLLDLAVETYRYAISLMPNYPDAYCNLANVLKEKGTISEAERCYSIAISLCPTHADSYNNLANIYREQGKVKESIEMYKKALEISPNFAAAHSNIATVLQQCGNVVEAINHYQKGIQANPGYAEGHCYLGNAFKEINNYKSAIECYLRALQINPLSADAHAYLGAAYKDTSNYSEAIQTFKIALRFRPNFPEVYCNLVHLYQIICDWEDYGSRMEKLVSIISEQLQTNKSPSVHPHHTMLYPLSPEQRKAIAARHAGYCLEKINFLGYKSNFTYPTSLEPGSRLKIGYVSSDFCNHPTSHLIQSVPGLHDKSKFEIFCFALSPEDDSCFRKKIKREVDHFIDLSSVMSPIEAAKIINSHGIHILLNLNGYTKGARNEIFAARPAPIQAMYLGYPGTSGATYMDYIITDPNTSPREHENHYSEKLAQMPSTFFIGDHAHLFPHVLLDHNKDNRITKIVGNLESYFKQSDDVICSNGEIYACINTKNLTSYICFHSVKLREEQKGTKDCGERMPELENMPIDRKSIGVPNNAFLFCNFNQLYKLDPATFKSWCNILNRVPNSYIWMLRFPKAGESYIRDSAIKNGVSPDRIVFTDVASKEEHVRRSQLADVCLDTPLCNGHTTGMDVLWGGCPIVTYPLNSFASRVASSLLTTIGCPELIANSFEDYENIAINLALDPLLYSKIKSKIWFGRISSPLFNVNLYASHMDRLFMKMWRRFEKGKELDHILSKSFS